MYQIQAQEASNEALKRIIKEEVEGVITLLTDDPEGDRETAVHEARKSLKRIRAALHLVREEIGEAVFGRENDVYRDAARHLSVLRDSDVMVETLDLIRMDDDEGRAAESFEAVRQRLVERKEAIHQEFFNQVDLIPGIVEALAEAGRRTADFPFRHYDFRAYKGGLRRVYRCGRRRMVRAYKDGNSPEKFHDWRKRVKYFWHQMEFLQPICPPVVEPMTGELHQLSDYLGEAHDAAVLGAYIRENERQFADERQRPLLLTRLSQRRQALETAAHPLGRRLYAEKPEAFVRQIAVYWKNWGGSGQ